MLHDAPCESAASWAANRRPWPSSVYVHQEGERIWLRFLDAYGLPISRTEERRIEGALLRGEQPLAPTSRIGQFRQAPGIRTEYLEEMVTRARISRCPLGVCGVSVAGTDQAALLLREALRKLGCSVGEGQPAVPVFSAEHGGLRLSAVDETGVPLAPERLLALLCMIEFEAGNRTIAVTEWAPAAMEALAEGCRANVLRIGRDGPPAEQLYRAQYWLHDGIYAAVRICARMGSTGESLHALCGRLPRFYVERREVPLSCDRGAVMRALAEENNNADSAGREGLHIRMGRGWVRIAPLNRRQALRIVGESMEAETAAELCALFERKTKQIEAKEKPRSSEESFPGGGA